MRATYGFMLSLAVVLALMRYLGAVTPATQTQNQTSQFRKASTNDQGLRQLATSAPTPSYPPTSLERKMSGVVVAAVTINENGRTRRVDILESPDDASGRAVRDAVRQWVFRSIGVPATGNLVFYFRIKGGQGLVSSPDEMKALNAVAAKATQLEGKAAVKEIDEAQFGPLHGALEPVVLDIRSRTAYLHRHREGAVNVPLRELLTRGGAELPRSRLIVIDCSAENHKADFCGVATHFLTSAGFSQVAVLKQ
jgi:TonB family protein